MTRRKYIITFSCLLVFIFSYQNVDAQQKLAQEVYAIIEQSCLICHGENGAYTEALIIDHTALVDDGTVVPEDPEGSIFYQRLIETDPAIRMPLGQPALNASAIETIRQWIAAGAPDWSDIPEPKPDFITTDTMVQTIEKHVNSLTPQERSFARYFTLTHLYNAGETTEVLNAYRRALSKLINSLSWGREVIKPQPIDVEKTVFYIDLRDYEWDVRNDAWTQIERSYPYQLTFDAPSQTHLHEKLTTLQQEMNCEVPFVHVDWFLATASLPPLYHDILALPTTDRELEAALEVYVAENLLNAPGKRVWRAGFNDSGVSRHNRVVERHISRYGAYWKSYDFAGSAEAQNIFTHPLDFTHDGGEIIFNLPNGLQAYYLVNGAGNRLDAAPINIVSNPAASPPTVRNGLSCIGCHTKGMKTFEDEVRDVVEQADNPPYNKERVLDLYVEKSVMDDLVDEDTHRYRASLEAAGGVFGGIEPIQRFYEVFQGPLSAAHAAAAVGLENDVVFRENISKNVSLQNLLGALVLENGAIKRDAWTSVFHKVVYELYNGNVPPPPPPKDDTVYIPDPILRAAIGAKLGKAPNEVIEVEDMESLLRLDSVDASIQDLTGLEFATNLEIFTVKWSFDGLLSDLSPLAGLTKVKVVSVSGKSITDLSPLAGLINIEDLVLFSTSVSDLSPLMGLTKMKRLYFNHAPVSDLSALTDLTNLEFLEIFYAEGPSLEPLKELVKLKKLSVGRSRISDISPLTGLVDLEELELFDNGQITDVSPLASLRNLRRLNLHRNKITDVSSLAVLHNLAWIDLAINNISDITPLERLPNDPNIIWYENPGFPVGGPKIEGPWVWAMVPGQELENNTDFISQASGGAVTELQVATYGAAESESVGESTWTPYNISATGKNNITEMTNALGWTSREEITGYIIYGSIKLNSPHEQQTTLFVGADDGVKVYLNGELIHKKFGQSWDPAAHDYQSIIPVTLNAGVNVLLVAIDNRQGRDWSGFFGFEPGTKYTIPSFGYTSSDKDIRVGDTFTIHFIVENIVDLAGWQFDIVFDPKILEVVEIYEGDFLKKDGFDTYFQQGSIDNTTGNITGISSARISERGINGNGTLLSVTFLAKGSGEMQLDLPKLQLGSITGNIITVRLPEIVINVGDEPTWDINQDGEVNILDLILVARDIGSGTPSNSRTDVNRDGIVNIQDLIIVAQHMGETTDSAAPDLTVIAHEELTPASVQAWIRQAQVENDGTLAFRQGIENLELLLALLIPEKTALLANYPNPFNPETWIPYQLAKSADVTMTIYAANGTVVRTLALGHKSEGMYQSRSRAAYWDGRNTIGEPVASSVYFYTLNAGNFTATRKMLILK